MNKEQRKGAALPAGCLSVLSGVAATLLLGGCASFSPDGGLSVTRTVAYAEFGKNIVKVSSEADAVATQQRVDALLKRPLTPDGAVQVALLKNRGLQAAFNELGVSEATVKAHVSAILQKLGVESRTQAVIVSSRIGATLKPPAGVE